MIWYNVINGIVLLLPLVSCLYEDQIGKFDWHQSYVGKVKHSLIDFKAKTKRVIVTTENNTIASLSPKSGSILWRHVLEDGAAGEILFLSLNNDMITTVSGNGPFMIRCWSSNNGIMLAEWPLFSISSSDNPYWFVNDGKLIVAIPFDQRLELTSYFQKDGEKAGQTRTINAPGLKPDTKLSVFGSWLGYLSLGTGELVSIDVSSSSTSAPVYRLEPMPSSAEPLPGGLPSFRLDYPTGSPRVALVTEKGLITATIPPSATATIYPYGYTHVVVTVEEKAGVYHVGGFELETGKPLSELSGRAEHTFPLEPARINSAFCVEERMSCYLLLVGTDHSLSLVNGGRLIWLREEALASIISVEMIGLPVSDTEAAIEKEFNSKEAGVLGMFFRRVASQLSQLQTSLGLGDDGSDSRSTLVRDAFGLHKIIVAVTSVSKVYGIDNLNGDIVWQYVVEGVEPCRSQGKPSVPFYVQRTARHHPYPAMCTLIFKSLKTKNSVLFVFNPINGLPLEGGLIDVGMRVLQALLLPENTEDFVKGLLLLSDKERLEVYPPAARSVALKLATRLYLFTADPVKEIISGYTLAYSKTELVASKVWSLRLPGELLAVASKNPSERVHSQGRVLSDRSVLYKYSNPNLVAFATFLPDGPKKEASSGVLDVFLVDVVSGSIKFEMSHKRVSPPVHLVHSENWLVYTYYNDKYRRAELVTLDLYEGKTQNNSLEFSSLTYGVEPLVEKQAYIFPHHVLAMKETITLKGITSKHVLVGVENGGVVEVPWAVLDPRRPSSPTPEAREEGVIPYVPELVLPSEAVITYNQTVAAISGIHTSPSALESTSLVFVYGLDLFYTRVMPSKMFDVLKDDFDYWLISAVLIGLSSAAWLTKRLAARKALRHGWK